MPRIVDRLELLPLPRVMALLRRYPAFPLVAPEAGLFATLADATLYAAGRTAIQGQLIASLADASLSAAARTAIQGQSIASLADASLSAAARTAIQGQLIASLADASLTAAARTAIEGQLIATLTDATLVATNIYAAGDPGAVAFSADMLTAGGSELKAFYLAHDATQFRTITGAGVSTLIDQVAGINATQGTDAKRPTVQAGAAGNSRDALRFVRTAGSALVTGASFTSVTGERWCALAIGKMRTSPPTALGRSFEWGIPAAGGDALSVHFSTTPTLNFNINDGTGESATPAYNSTAAFAAAVAFTDKHSYYLNGAWTDLTRTAGVGSRGNGNVTLSIGRACDADNGFLDMDLWALAVFKMSGTVVPSGFATMMALARTYYATATI